MTPPLKSLLLAAALLPMLLHVSACEDQETTSGGNAVTSETTPADPAPSSPRTTDQTDRPTPTQDASENTGAAMDIQLTIKGTQLRGTLDDTPAGRDFASMLPLTLTLTDFHDTEKISDLPRRLASTEDDAPAGTAGSPGDLTIYAPWGNLAIFYRDFTYTDDLIRLGRLEPDAADLIARIQNGTAITIEPTN
jgi:hypothetical protein